jgi:uroporphyrinogen-III synthase
MTPIPTAAGIAGKHIVVTRAVHQASALTALLQQAGAIAVHYPCIAIAPPTDTAPLDAALRDLARYDWVLLTSSNTPYALAARAEAIGLAHDAMARAHFAAVGPATSEALYAACGMQPAFMPPVYDGASLARALPAGAGAHVLLPTSSLADDSVAQTLTARGIRVHSISAYRTVAGAGGEDVPARLAAGGIDAITFTSGSTVRFFVQRVAPLQPLHVPAVCIGESTAVAARAAGFATVLVPERATLEAMLDTLRTYFESERHAS